MENENVPVQADKIGTRTSTRSKGQVGDVQLGAKFGKFVGYPEGAGG
jgi:hypothetical protein